LMVDDLIETSYHLVKNGLDFCPGGSNQ
jgi:hypothetical protein